MPTHINIHVELFRLSVEIMFSRDYSANIRYGSGTGCAFFPAPWILVEFSLDTFSGFPGRLFRPLLAHPYEQMFSTQEFVKHLENIEFKIDGFKNSNPFKMIQHFYLVASAQSKAHEKTDTADAESHTADLQQSDFR
jgi:hypothetical protein